MESIIISSGTLRPEDLLPAFWGHVPTARQSEIMSGEYGQDVAADVAAMESGTLDYDSDEAAELLIYVQDVLDDCAPDGMWFGAHEGDGALFGFWLDEDDDQ